MGGGVVQSGDATGLRVQASGPLDATGDPATTEDRDKATQWYTAVANGSGEPRNLKVFAICAKGTTATIEATDFDISDDSVADASANCGPGHRALGGGVVQADGLAGGGLSLLASGPLDASGETLETKDGDKPQQWYVRVGNNSGDRDLKLLAICEWRACPSLGSPPMPASPVL